MDDTWIERQLERLRDENPPGGGPDLRVDSEPAPYSLVGRERELAEASAFLADTGERTIVVLQGPRGAGSSAIARELGRREAARYPGGVLWIDASTANWALPPLDLVALAAARELKGLDPRPEPCCRAHFALTALSAEPTLLILDGAESWESVREWLPPEGGRCHVLVTGRTGSWPRSWNPIEIGKLASTDAEQVVRERWPGASQKAVTCIVEAAAGCLTVMVTLAQAGSAIGASGSAHAALLKRLGADGGKPLGAPAMLAFEPLGDQQGGVDARILLHTLFVAADRPVTWSELCDWICTPLEWSAERLARAVAACLRAELLEADGRLRFSAVLSAALAATLLPRREKSPLKKVRARQRQLLLSYAPGLRKERTDHALAARFLTLGSWASAWALEGRFAGPAPTLEQVRDVVQALCLLNQDDITLRSANTGLALARFSRRTAQSKILGETLADLHAALGKVLRDARDFAGASKRFEEEANLRSSGEARGTALHEAGVALISLGSHAAGRGLLERALVEKQRGDSDGRVDQTSVAHSYYYIAWSYDGEDRVDVSRKFYEQSVATYRQAPEAAGGKGFDHDALGAGLFRIALGYQRRGDYGRAVEYFEQAAEEESRGGDDGLVDHLEVGRTLYERAWSLEALHRYEDAIECYGAAAENEALGDSHGTVDFESLGGTYHARARSISRTGDLERAGEEYLRAAEFRARGDRYGVVDEEGVGASLHMAGLAFRRAGLLTRARELFERSLEAGQRGDGSGRLNHEGLGRTLHEIGHCLYGEGRVEEARHWYELAVEEKQQGDFEGQVDFESLGLAHEMVAACLNAEGDFEGARAAFEKAVAAAEKGDTNEVVHQESVRNHCHRLGVTCAQAGDHSAARTAFQRAIEEGTTLSARDLEFDRRDLASSWIDLGASFHATNEEAEAGRCYERAVELCTGPRIDGFDDGGAWWALHGVGLSLLRAERLDEAVAWFERAAAAAELGGVDEIVDQERVSKSLHEGGWCLADQGRTSDALLLFERALEASRIGDRDGRVDAHSVGTTLHEIGWCLAEDGRLEEARERFREAAAEKEKGRVDGTIDDDSIARTLNELGWCYLHEEDYEQGRAAYERAFERFERAAEQGRANPDGQSAALRAIGRCLLLSGDAKAARPWFERAVAKYSFGDARGNVDHTKLGLCLRLIGDCYEDAERFPRARAWFERAVEALEKGGPAGEIDREGLRIALRSVGDCFEREGQYEQARHWHARAEGWAGGE